MGMAEQALLTKVKNAIGITGDFQDATIGEYIAEVKGYLKSAGVPDAVLQSEKVAGIVSRGVLDLWNYGAGDGSLSPYFYQRAVQLIYSPVEEDE